MHVVGDLHGPAHPTILLALLPAAATIRADCSAGRLKVLVLGDTIGPFRISAMPLVRCPIPAIASRMDVDGCVAAFCGDTSKHTRTLEALAEGSNLFIVHNAVPKNADPVALRLHIPPSEIDGIVTAAKVRKLVLSHRRKRTLGRGAQTLAQARLD